MGCNPVKKFGQNFLVDRNVVEKFVRLAVLEAGDNVVEIGPGLAMVSDEILKYGTKLSAIELDSRLFNFLAAKYERNRNVSIMKGNAVKFPIATLDKSNTKFQNYKIVSNLPYAISSAWFEALLRCYNLPESISIIIQLDTAERFLAQSGTKLFGPISIFLQSAYTKIAAHKISKNSFYPPPSVDSIMLFLAKREHPVTFSLEVRKTIRRIFTNRRKQIAKISNELEVNMEDWLKRNKISPNTRPEQIGIEAWQNFENIVAGAISFIKEIN
jgi:16S rRNA (adenine1518-N6/adenine1519-N6)-dimethyltransferase